MNISAMCGKLAVAVLICGLTVLPASAGEVRAAVSSDLAAPMERIIEQFQMESGHVVRVILAASGKLHAQIAKGGAPFDVFLSADEELPKRLLQNGQAVAGSRFVYATGRLALWSAQPGFVDDKGLILSRGNFNTLAIANPRYSPYGVATQETLTRLIMWNAMQRKLDRGDDVAAAWRMAATERAELAFVALSQIMRNGKVQEGSWWLVPAEMHNPIRQSAVLLAGAQDKAAAREFLAFLQRDKTRALLRGFGYE